MRNYSYHAAIVMGRYLEQACFNYVQLIFVRSLCLRIETDPCDSSAECAFDPETTCVADYCQPSRCTATGQCVFGQVCSHNVDARTCVCTLVKYIN